MSEYKVLVVKIDKVEPHPNADNLDIVFMNDLNYLVITQKDNFKSGDLGFYFPIDTVLTNEWVEKFNLIDIYKKKIRAIKLRGIVSQGFIHPVTNDLKNVFKVGDDAKEHFSASKYIEPELYNKKKSGISNRVISDIGDYRFDSPEHFSVYYNQLVPGEEIIVTEKIHGTNFSIIQQTNEVLITSHNKIWKKETKNVYTRIYEEYSELQYIPKGIQLFGEIFGVQDIKYGLEKGEIDYRIFAIKYEDKYLDYDRLIELTEYLNIKTCPILYRGEYRKDIIDKYKTMSYSTLDKDSIIEGVVIIPKVERLNTRTNNRLCLKHISDRYLLREKGSEMK